MSVKMICMRYYPCCEPYLGYLWRLSVLFLRTNTHDTTFLFTILLHRIILQSQSETSTTILDPSDTGKEKPWSYAPALSSNMHDYAPEDVLKGAYMVRARPVLVSVVRRSASRCCFCFGLGLVCCNTVDRKTTAWQNLKLGHLLDASFPAFCSLAFGFCSSSHFRFLLICP